MTRRRTPLAGEMAHITVRCNNKKFLLEPEVHFSAIVSWLNTLPFFFNIEIYHAVIMSNHIHLLLQPNDDQLGKAMCYFLTNLSKYLNFKRGAINHSFGKRYCPTLIDHSRHLMNVIRYIYQNPVRAGLVTEPQHYKYSTLTQHLGLGHTGLKLACDVYTTGLFESGIRGIQNWLDTIECHLSESDTLQIKTSLMRGKYSFSREQMIKLHEQGTSLMV